MPTPAHHQAGLATRIPQACVAQNIEHDIGDRALIRQLPRIRLLRRICLIRVGGSVRHPAAHVDHVSEHREQVLLDALDHLAIDEGTGWRVAQVDLDAAHPLDHLDVEVPVLIEHRHRIVGVGPAVEHRERALSQ